jgi:geranylgeranyl pyrophosphate synthase
VDFGVGVKEFGSTQVMLIENDINIINKRLNELAGAIEPASSFLNAPSKRIRPLLALLCLRAQGLEVREEHYTFLSAIELIHNASLIHDDIIDDSTVRRDQDTLNKNLGNKLALITGDYLLSLAMNEVARLNSPQIVNMLAETLKNMCLGEFSQHYKKFQPLTLEEYLLKTEQKTAGLFTAAVQGCEMLDAKPSTINHQPSTINHQLSTNFGIAFQICNDLHDTEKDRAAGVFNTPASEQLLKKYIDKALEFTKPLDDNEYKSALVGLLERYGQT